MSTTYERSPLERVIDRAFKYHPYWQATLLSMDDWVVGPTFICKGKVDIPTGYFYGTAHFGTRPDWQQKATRLLTSARSATQIAEVSKGGHSMEQVMVKNKWGAEVPRGPVKCTFRAIVVDGVPIGELAYPLYSLGKKVGAVEYRVDTSKDRPATLYGYDKAETLVSILAGKDLGGQCVP